MKHLALLAVLVSSSAAACPGLEVTEAWIRATPPGAMMTAAYAQLINRGEQPLFIDRVFGDAFAGAEIHRTEIRDGLARMTAVHRLEVPAGGSLALSPGAAHVMLFRPAHALEAGAQLALGFACGEQAREFRFTVRAPG